MFVFGVSFVAALQWGCGECPPTIMFERVSPSGNHTAIVYQYQCGGVLGDFNTHVGLKQRNSEALHEVADVSNLPWTASATRTADDRLLVVFDCRDFPGSQQCGARADRYWSVDGNPNWRGVQIEYDVSERLRRGLTAEDLRHLPLK